MVKPLDKPLDKSGKLGDKEKSVNVEGMVDETDNSKTKEEDEILIKLLKSLDEYETLSETFKAGYQDSFLELSKKKLNNDFVIDLRPRLAALNVIDLKLVNLLNESDVNKDKGPKTDSNGLIDTKEDSNISLIRNRLSKTTILKEPTKEIEETLPITNPLDQFGLVNMKPLQQKFLDSITTTLELHKKRTELQELLSELHV